MRASLAKLPQALELAGRPADPQVLSIIIVTYNSRDEVAGCLESIPSRVLDLGVEVIVVDNASPDGTLEFVAGRFPQFLSLPAGGNLGFGKANNLGYRQSRGGYLLFLNPDTVVNLPALEHCVARIRDEAAIGILSPRLAQENGEMDLACRRSIPTIWDGFTRATGLATMFPKNRWFSGYNLTYLPEQGTYPVGAVNGAFLLLRRGVFEELGQFDEEFFMYGDDLDLCYRCSRTGYQVVYDGSHSIIHLKGRSSSKEYRAMSKALFVGTKQFYLKHFNPRNSAITRCKYDVLFWLWYQVSLTLSTLHRRKVARPA